MPDFQYRRLPAIEKKISEISPEHDVRIRILGRIIDKANETIVVDDGTGSAEIITSDLNVTAGIDDLVRVFTRVLPLEEGYELRAEIIQDMSILDMELYKKIKA